MSWLDFGLGAMVGGTLLTIVMGLLAQRGHDDAEQTALSKAQWMEEGLVLAQERHEKARQAWFRYNVHQRKTIDDLTAECNDLRRRNTQLVGENRKLCAEHDQRIGQPALDV